MLCATLGVAMNAPWLRVLLVGLPLVLSCKPVSTGPFTSLIALEKWHRSDPATNLTGTGLITFHQDTRVPRWADLDEHCGAHFGNWAQSPNRKPSFGDVRMTVSNGSQMTWAEDEEGMGWEAAAGETAGWDSGDTLNVTAAGGEAPGFSLETVVPEQVVLTSHDLASLAANQLHVARGAPLELRWQPTTGSVLLLFLQFPASNALHKERGIWCVFPASTGTVSVPPSVLENLVPSRPGLNTNIYFGGGSVVRRDVDGLDLRIVTFKNEAARIQVD